MSKILRSMCAHPIPASIWSLCLMISMATVGCGVNESYHENSASYEPDIANSGDVHITEDDQNVSTEPVAEIMEESARPANDHLAKKLAQRKVVYNSDMHLEVQEFEKAVDELRNLIDEHMGFVASHNIDGGAGSRRSGHWKIRVPSISFDSFHVGLKKLGYPIQDKLDSREVTEEYVDVQHRIENLKQMEARLSDLLKTNTKSLSDIFQVEKELSRVNGEIERMQGRLELLKDMTSLATINLDISEEDVYEPPVVVAEIPPTFQEQVRETFGSSAGSMITVVQTISLMLIAMTPWLPFLIPVAILIRYLTKRYRAASMDF